MDRLEFLKHEFPQLKENINGEEGLLHLEINLFHCYVQKALLRIYMYNVPKVLIHE